MQASETAPLARTAAPEPPENAAVAAVVIDEKELEAAAAAAARADEKTFSPQAAVRALWKAATGSRAGTVTR